MFVLVDDRQKFIDGGHGKSGLVAVPLEVGTLPEYLPQILGPDVRRLGDRIFSNDSSVIPLRTYFKNFDTPFGQAVPNIQVGTNIDRWAALGEKAVQGLFNSLLLDIVECHRSRLFQLRDYRFDLRARQVEQSLAQHITHEVSDAMAHLRVVPKVLQALNGVAQQGFIKHRQ